MYFQRYTIPYYDKNSDGSFKEMYYEGDQYPKYVPVTNYEEYDFENRRLCELLGGEIAHIPKRPGEPDCSFADTTKIEGKLGWKAKVTFEEGVHCENDFI